MPPSHEKLVGRLVGDRYEIVALVGRGAMADVFRARDTQRGTHVAVKIVATELVTSSVAAARFQREVKASSKLDHPAIVRVHAWGIDADYGFIVMDLVEGDDLYERLRLQGVFRTREAITIAIQVLSGLEVAHAAGVIHRDLKPENVMLAPSGQIRILDFGIAKLHRGPQSGHEEETMPESLTRAGTAVGTPSHMAPEQARGGPVDGRADLYAVGVLLYEMVTGRLPFEGKSPVEVIMKQVRDLPVPPRQYAPALPQELEMVILQALEKDPTSRPRSALAMRKVLEEILAQLDEDEELDVPTRTADRPPALRSTTTDHELDIPTLDRDTASEALDRTDRDAATLDRGWQEPDEITAMIPGPEDEDATSLISLTRDRYGPGGTLVYPEGDDEIVRAARAAMVEEEDEETATQVAPSPDLLAALARRRRAEAEEATSVLEMPIAGPAPPDGMPSIHAWTSAPPPPRPEGRSELDALLRQLPPPRVTPWRTIAVVAAVVASFGALLWALVT